MSTIGIKPYLLTTIHFLDIDDLYQVNLKQQYPGANSKGKKEPKPVYLELAKFALRRDRLKTW